MTTRPIVPPSDAAAPSVKQFPDFPPRDDMNNSVILDEPGWQPALRRHLAATHSGLLVISELPMGWRHDQRSGILVPDLLIAFDVDRDAIIRQRGYAISEWGKPPEFVLEIASIHTARNDEVGKRIAYARYGVGEYWRFDAEWGRYYSTGLAGDEKDDTDDTGESHRPVAIHQYAPGMYWGHSRVLNLDLCWEHGALRWYDPVARRYLDTYDEEADGRVEERAGRILAEMDRDTERAARIVAEGARDADRAARIVAESARDADRAARIVAESARDADRAARIVAESQRDAERAARIAEQAARIAAQSEAQQLRDELRRLRQQ